MTKEKVLVVGSGGREHALGWKLAQSPNVEEVYFAPGNAGTAGIGINVDIKADDVIGLLTFAHREKIGLTVVGPEVPLGKGIVDIFIDWKLPIFGPTKNAAMLETSKAFACEFMKRHEIPYPRTEVFNNFENARQFLRGTPPWFVDGISGAVIKADGLAAGKGVSVCSTLKEAEVVLENMMEKKYFGRSGETVVIQEPLKGPEISVLAISDGKKTIPLPPAQDHKRAFDNDEGPNTGGMGAIAPYPVGQKLLEEIQRTILEPTIEGMRKEGNPFKGILFAGLILTDKGPKVLEFNARFGDPETQPQMMLLDSDLYEIMMACIDGTLEKRIVRIRNGASCCVVLASQGYPGHYEKGKEISGLGENYGPDVQIFHAGTKLSSGIVQTSGGRVLGVTAYGETLDGTIKKAHSVIGKNGVHFPGMHYRRDIGKQGLKNSKK